MKRKWAVRPQVGRNLPKYNAKALEEFKGKTVWELRERWEPTEEAPKTEGGVAAAEHRIVQRARRERANEKEQQKIDRKNRIVFLRLNQHLSLAEIGTKIGVSRERIRQILVKVQEAEGVVFPRYVAPRGRRVAMRVAVSCTEPGCLNKIENTEGFFKRFPNKKFKCQEHIKKRAAYGKMYGNEEEWKKMSKQERDRWKYRNVRVVRERQRSASSKWYFTMAQNPAYKEKVKAYFKEYYKRKRAKEEAILAEARKKIEGMGLDRINWSTK